MSDLTTRTTAKRLNTLAQLYERGQTSPLLDRALAKALTYEAAVSRQQLEQLQADLAELEQRYGLSSAEFYQQYQAGQTDDQLDYTEWAALLQMANNLQERLRLLADAERP
jgi:hypothetical protein